MEVQNAQKAAQHQGTPMERSSSAIILFDFFGMGIEGDHDSSGMTRNTMKWWQRKLIAGLNVGDCWNWEERNGIGTTYRTETVRGSSVKRKQKKTPWTQE